MSEGELPQALLSDNRQKTQPEQPKQDKALSKKRSRVMIIVIGIFLLIFLMLFLYWWFWGQYSESTDDAYVNGNKVIVMPQVQGIVTGIYADNAQIVTEGQTLLTLDTHDAEISFDQAQASLGQAVRDVVQFFAQVYQLEALREVRKADLLRAHLDYEHRKNLVDSGSVSQEDFEHSETTLYAAYASLQQVDEDLAAAVAEVEGTTIATHPRVEVAKAMVKEAFLALYRCTIYAPATGLVGERKAQVGQTVMTSTPLLSVVPLDQMWIDANYREVQLKNLRVGQKVDINVDMYGGSVHYHGQIIGLNPGTGSVFSLLPPQNASGNWIKIVQRIPVRISLDQEEIKKYPLLLGLSVETDADTRDRSGPRLPPISQDKLLYTTTIFDDELDGVEAIIEEIIEQNTYYE